MPTYDYECDACGHKFELFQGINDKVQRKCPKCGKLKLRRLIGAGGAIMFKGSGFYKTDYRSESYKSQGRGGQAGQQRWRLVGQEIVRRKTGGVEAESG